MLLKLLVLVTSDDWVSIEVQLQINFTASKQNNWSSGGSTPYNFGHHPPIFCPIVFIFMQFSANLGKIIGWLSNLGNPRYPAGEVPHTKYPAYMGTFCDILKRLLKIT